MDNSESDQALSKKEHNIALFYIFYTGMRDLVISEKDFVGMLHQLYKNGFRTYHIDNYYELLNQMEHNNLIHAYKFSSMLCQHNVNYKDLCKIADIFPDIISKNNIHEEIRLNIPYIQKRLKEKDRLMRAFERFDNEILESEYNEFTRKDLFEQNNSMEIIRRLHQLVNAFGLDCLKLMNVNLITITEVKNMNYTELWGYYRQCIERIKETILHYTRLCRDFQMLVPRLEHIFGY